ncbi:MAG: hypothetical protein IT330_04770 [Anaerolineae bacterium]|nr:hypothetical protein [Anaerolineae bacterium]
MQDIYDVQVPSDRILPCPYPFTAPAASEFRALFADAHANSESVYNGDGSWGHGFVHDESSARWRALFARPEDFVDWPTVRDTARRLAAYAWALDVEPNPLYRQRLAAGVEWLLKQQLPDGSFPWWVSRTGMANTDHLYYKNGYAAIGLLEAYRHLPEPRLLEAVRRAADWTAAWRVSPNNNYNSLACWVLTAYHRHDPQPRYLDAAVQKTMEGVLPGQLANGGWAGHNSWVYYQGIIVSGLAMLVAILPDDHPQQAAIRACLIRAVNNLVVRQNEGGYLLSTFDPQERAEAERRRIGYEKSPVFMADGHALLGLLWLDDLLGYEVRPLIFGLLRAYAERTRTGDPELALHESHGEHDMVLGYAWRWLSR